MSILFHETSNKMTYDIHSTSKTVYLHVDSEIHTPQQINEATNELADKYTTFKIETCRALK